MASALSRLLAGAVVTSMAAIGVVALAAPASAAISGVTPTSWAYTDSAAPTSKFVNPTGDAPVGAQVYASGTVHSTKAYFTFDLSTFAGGTIGLAQFITDEQSVADCTKDRTQQVWLTATDTAPTWKKAPAEQTQLAGPVGVTWQCPSGRLVWDATTVLQNAVAAGSKKITLELRLPDDQQNDPSRWRSFDHAPLLSAHYNRPPLTPTDLAISGQACGKKPLLLGNFDYTLSAKAVDPDNDLVGNEVNLWPVDHPDQVTTLTTGVGTMSGSTPKNTVQKSTLVDGATYAWKVRTTDGQASGPWSEACEFTTDQTAPAAPTVSSTDYPADQQFHGGTGIPGAFTVTANGATDVVGFRYGFDQPATYATANHHGTATLPITPTRSGPLNLVVQSVDAAGNYSLTTSYRLLVTDNAPSVSCTPATSYPNTLRTCTVSPHDATQVGYVYQVDNGNPTDLPAGPDGKASFTVTPGTTLSTVKVQARLTNGNLTGARTAMLFVDPGAPTTDQSAYEVVQGAPVQFTFHSVLPGSTTFTYTWGNHTPVTVPVGSDGTATVSLTTDQSGSEELDLYSSTADGLRSGIARTWITVDSNGPTVASTDYQQGTWGGGVGMAGTFTFTPVAPNVVSYTYHLNDGTPVTVLAAADGTATVSITPTLYGSQDLYVTANLADGSETDQTDYFFLVNDVPTA